MTRTDHGEVSPIERGNPRLFVPFGDRNEIRIGPTQRQVDILLDKFSDPRQVASCQRLELEFPGSDCGKEVRLGRRSELTSDEVGGLREYQCCREQAAGLLRHQLSARLVVGVARIGGGKENASVDDEHSAAPEAVGQHGIGIAGSLSR